MSANAGHNVILVDVNEELVTKGVNIIDTSLKRVMKKKFPEDESAASRAREAVMARIATSTAIEDASSTADLVVEAVTENLQLKRKLWASIDAAAPVG